LRVCWEESGVRAGGSFGPVGGVRHLFVVGPLGSFPWEESD